MTFCASCGHQLGVGRFCTNCGQPVTSAAPPAAPEPPAPAVEVPAPGPDTEERRAVRRDAALVPAPPRTPPAAEDMPPPPRFPLYADEVELDDDRLTRTQVVPWTETDGTGSILARFAPEPAGRTADEALAALHLAADGEDEYEYEGDDHPAHASRRRGVALLVLLLLAAVVATLVIWSTTRDDDPARDAGAKAADAEQLASEADVKVPGKARPSREVDGTEVTYGAANLVDGDATTAWRVAGDASGKKIVLRFPDEVTVDRVGLVNGYAKEATDAAGRRFDWYHGHRTIARVVWIFDDGSRVRQDLQRDRTLQDVAVDAVTTRTVTLRLVEVGKPGSGRASRDFTAISEIEVAGPA